MMYRFSDPAFQLLDSISNKGINSIKVKLPRIKYVLFESSQSVSVP